MSANKGNKAKGRQSSRNAKYYEQQVYRTIANKAKNAKKQAKRLAKLAEKRLARVKPGKDMKPANERGSKFTWPKHTPREHPTFTVLVKETGKRVDGVSIDSVNEQKEGNSSIILVTHAGKKWRVRFDEFSTVFPATEKVA